MRLPAPTPPSSSSGSYNGHGDRAGRALHVRFAHLAGSTSDFSIAATSRVDGSPPRISQRRTIIYNPSIPSRPGAEAAAHLSAEEIWLMGVRLPGWGVEDEGRVAATSADKSSSSHSHLHHGHHRNPLSPKRRSSYKSHSPASSHPPPTPEPIRDLPSLSPLPSPRATIIHCEL
jgi:hypothetical protein